MKVTLIYPRIGDFDDEARMEPLSLGALAGLTPAGVATDPSGFPLHADQGVFLRQISCHVRLLLWRENLLTTFFDQLAVVAVA